MIAAAVSAVGLLGAAADAIAQVQVVNSIRLELRIQPQVGLPADPGGVVDVPGGVHLPITAPGQLRRFEVQYRLVDLDPDDDVVPASVASFGFHISFTGSGNSTLERAVLSRDETNGAPLPAVSPDLSGPPLFATTPAREARGLHWPFTRTDGPPATFPFNNAAENGRLAPGPGGQNQVIRDILPLLLSPFDGFVVGAWYGLYSFDFISGSDLGGDVVLTATLDAPPSEAAFGYFASGSPGLVLSNSAASTPATIPIPAPVPSTLALGVLSILARRRR